MKTFIVGVAALLCVAPRAHAQSLSLGQAVDMAMRSHPTLSLAAANLARAQSGVREVRATQLPTLSVDASLTQFQKPMLAAPLHGFDLFSPPVFDRTLAQGSVALGYTLFDASRSGAVQSARALADAARADSSDAHMQLLLAVTRAYVTTRALQDVAEAQAGRLAALDRESDRAAQLVAEGRAARVVLMRAQAAHSAARADEVTTASNLAVARNELARQLGMNVDSMRTVQLQPVRVKLEPLPDVGAVRAMARETNPQLARARFQIAAADRANAQARGRLLPRVQLGARVIEYASTESHGQSEWQGGAQVSYGIFTGGARSAAIDRSSAELRAAQATYELTARRIDDEIDATLASNVSGHARNDALEAAAAQSEEVARIEKLALDSGAGVQTDYLTAEADLFRARAALSDSRARQLMTRVELAYLTGQLTEAWLARNTEPYQ